MTRSDLNNVKKNEKGEQLKELFDYFLLPTTKFYYLALSALKLSLSLAQQLFPPPLFLVFFLLFSLHPGMDILHIIN